MPVVKVPLSKPLTTHDGVLSELTLREPSARDYIALKRVPFSIVFHQTIRAGEVGGAANADAVTERTGELNTDYDLAFQWIARLTGIDTLILGTLGNRDVGRVINKLREVVGDAADDQEDQRKVEDQVKN